MIPKCILFVSIYIYIIKNIDKFIIYKPKYKQYIKYKIKIDTLFVFRPTQLFINNSNRRFGLARHPVRGALFRMYFQKEKSIHHSSADVIRVMIRNMTDSWA